MISPQAPSLRLELQMQQVPPNPAGFEPLHVPVEWMRYCDVCDLERIFVANTHCGHGLIAKCSHCGDERLAPFTRANSDVEWKELT